MIRSGLWVHQGLAVALALGEVMTTWEAYSAAERHLSVHLAAAVTNARTAEAERSGGDLVAARAAGRRRGGEECGPAFDGRGHHQGPCGDGPGPTGPNVT